MDAYVSLRGAYSHYYDYMRDTLSPNTKDVADYTYRCTSKPGSHLPLPGTYTYYLLAFEGTTPADTYAVAWSCAPSSFGHVEILWILTKSRTYNDALIQQAIAKVQGSTVGLQVNESFLIRTRQDGCTNVAANNTNVFVPPKAEASMDKQELKKLLITRLNNPQ